MSNKAIFLDRDGVINVDFGYVHKVSDFSIIPGVVEALSALQAAGYLLVVITNQAGIARGLYTESDFLKLTEYMTSYFAGVGVTLAGVYHCPHHPLAGKIRSLTVKCMCRKPGIGMIVEAQRKHGVDLKRSWLVGDKITDIQAGVRSGIGGNILVGNAGLGLESCEGVKYFGTSDLLSASKYILRRSYFEY